MLSLEVHLTIRSVIGRQLNHPGSPLGSVCDAASAQSTSEEHFRIWEPTALELHDAHPASV